MPVIVEPKYTEFGKRLKAVRCERGLSQKQLLVRVGIKDISAISRYERGLNLPSDDKLARISKELNTTPEYLLDGKVDKDPIPKTVIKELNTNNDGYNDPTAGRALLNVINSTPKKSPEVGDVVEDHMGMIFLVVQKYDNDHALLLDVQTTKNPDVPSCAMKFGDTTYYIYLTSFCTHEHFSKFYRTKFKATEVSYQVVINKFRKLLDLEPIKNVEETEPVEIDETSRIFADSVLYFNRKSGSNIPKPEGVVSLGRAIEISKLMEIPLEEFLKDHEAEEKFDKLCKLEEEVAKLKAELGL